MKLPYQSGTNSLRFIRSWTRSCNVTKSIDARDRFLSLGITFCASVIRFESFWDISCRVKISSPTDCIISLVCCICLPVSKPNDATSTGQISTKFSMLNLQLFVIMLWFDYFFILREAPLSELNALNSYVYIYISEKSSWNAIRVFSRYMRISNISKFLPLIFISL